MPGGYLSWMIPSTGDWWQAIFTGNKISYRSKSVLSNKNKSWREIIDTNSFDQLKPIIGKKILPTKSKSELFAEPLITVSSNGRGNQLREDIKALLKSL